MKVNKTVDDEGIIRYENEKGEYHREDGPAIEFSDGAKSWYINGKRHREDGPAYIDGDYKVWYINGKRHREDGPAHINGDYKAWWINDIGYTEEEFELEIVKKKLQKIKEL